MNRKSKTNEAAAIFGEQAARTVAIQALHSIERSLDWIWKEATEGGSDKGGWPDEDADASIALQIALEERNRIEDEAHAGANSDRLAGNLVRLHSLLKGVNALRTNQDDFSSRLLSSLCREINAYATLIEHTETGERFAKKAGGAAHA